MLPKARQGTVFSATAHIVTAGASWQGEIEDAAAAVAHALVPPSKSPRWLGLNVRAPLPLLQLSVRECLRW